MLFVCLFVLSFGAAPTAYESSQVRGRIRAAAAGLHHSHSNTGSEPHLWPTLQRVAKPDTKPTERGQGSNPCILMEASLILTPLSHDGKSCDPYIFFFLELHPRHMEVPRLGVESELQLLAYATATATRDLSRV